MKAPTNIAGYDPTRNTAGCTFDADAAQRAVDFFPAVLTYQDDSHSGVAGQPFKLQRWQQDYVATLFGWKRPDGTRRYRESLLAVPRKNGKSTLLSGIALYCLASEGKLGSQIYSAACDRHQAGLIYTIASRMVHQHPMLEKRLNCVDSTKRITFRERGAFYTAMSGDANPAHGTKPYVVLFDELHTQRDRRLYDNLKTGQGASPGALFLNITTAGWDRNSLCWEVWRYARNVRDGIKPDPYFLPVLYEIKEGQNWEDESVWYECNPNLDVTFPIDFLREHFERAKASPGYENTFRNLYLNDWTEQAVRWLSMRHWDACDEELPDLTGIPCWGALDMSSTTDITAFVLVFPLPDGKYAVKAWFWIPGDTADRKERVDAVPYRQWQKEGRVFFTPGNRVDHFCVRDDIMREIAGYDVQEIVVDRAMAALVTRLLQESFDPEKVVEFPQVITHFTGPSKLLEKLVLGKELIHGGDPVLRWMASNVGIEDDKNENIRPVKSKSTGRIDGIVALIMGLGRAAAAGDVSSIYETRGIAFLGQKPEPQLAAKPATQWGGDWRDDDD